MKKLIILILSIIIVQHADAQNQDAQENLYFMGGVGDDEISDAISDEEGNVYLIGSYNENLDSRDDRLTSAGGIDMFVAKFDKDMNRVWIKSIGGKSNDYGNSISTDRLGNVYMMTTFNDSINVDNVSFKSNDRSDILISSMDPEGKTKWNRQLKGKGNYEGVQLTTDKEGNIYAIITFTGTIELGNKKFKATSDKDALLVKMDPKGNITRTNQLGGLYDNTGADVAVDEMGNVYFVGNFKGKINIAGGEYVTDGNVDIFLVKYSPDGKLLWVERSRGEDVNRANGMVVDKAGNVYLTGSFERYISFDDKRVSSASDKDMFLVKYNPEGDVEWLRYAAGGFAHDRGNNVGIDKDENIYVTGTYTGNITFIDQNLEGMDMRQIFIAKYSPEGEVLSVKRAGGVGTENSLYVIPTFYGVITVGEFDEYNTLSDVPLKSQGGRDLFIRKNE